MTTPHSAPHAPELTATDESQFASALGEQRRFRIEQLAQLAETETGAGHPVGSLEVTAALKRGAAHALTEIEAALTRLQDGCYGICTGCGQEIIRERLEVLPAAALCMACQRRADEDRTPVPVGADDGSRRPG